MTEIGKSMQNYLLAQRMADSITMKSWRSKIHKKPEKISVPGVNVSEGFGRQYLP